MILLISRALTIHHLLYKTKNLAWVSCIHKIWYLISSGWFYYPHFIIVRFFRVLNPSLSGEFLKLKILVWKTAIVLLEKIKTTKVKLNKNHPYLTFNNFCFSTRLFLCVHGVRTLLFTNICSILFTKFLKLVFNFALLLSIFLFLSSNVLDMQATPSAMSYAWNILPATIMPFSFTSLRFSFKFHFHSMTSLL